MDNPKISVIVPIYKVELYLHRCINSLLTQTFSDFEILLIDDGSPDGSGEICEEYARKDSRVRVFHKENGGVSSARNLGLKECRGEWIAFVDADDYVDANYLSIDEKYSDADVIEKSFTTVWEDTKREEYKIFSDGMLSQKKIYYYFVNKRNNALWNKLFSRKLIASTRFDVSVSIGEDFLFFLSLIPRIKRYAFSAEGRYYYIVHKLSAMQMVNNLPQERIKVLWKNMNLVKSMTTTEELYPLQCGIVYGTYLLLLYSYWIYLTDDEKRRLKQQFKQMKYKDLFLLASRKKMSLILLKQKIRFKA